MADTARRFDALVTPHLATLHRVAYRFTRNSPDAHDLVQETCVIACENLDDLEKTDRPVRWLLRVMQNRFFNLAERRRASQRKIDKLTVFGGLEGVMKDVVRIGVEEKARRIDVGAPGGASMT